MSQLLDVYRTAHQQGFMPIFTADGFDSKRQVKACVEAGIRVIEYTLRKPDAREMIPWIRAEYPELYLVVGSTIDDEEIVRQCRRRFPQLMTLAELADLGVDGFVSMIGWSEASIRRYSSSHLIMPAVGTVTEALQQIGWGAHMAKVAADLELQKRLRAGAAFDYCPILATGGVTEERVQEVMEAGAVMVASGFDLTLKGRPTDISTAEIADVMRRYVAAAQQAQAAVYPELLTAEAGNDEWLASLPHVHPF